MNFIFHIPILLYLTCMGLESLATTCDRKQIKTEFIVKCENNICKEGFLVSRKHVERCSVLLNVKGDEIIYSIDGNLGLLQKDNEVLDGFYAIEVIGRKHANENFNEKECFGLNEKPEVSVKCLREPRKFTKLPISANDNMQSALDYYVSLSQREYFIREIWEWLLPILLLPLVVLSWRNFQDKQGAKYIIAILILSIIGLSETLYGRPYWLFAGIAGLIHSTIWFMAYLNKRIRKRYGRN